MFRQHALTAIVFCLGSLALAFTSVACGGSNGQEPATFSEAGPEVLISVVEDDLGVSPAEIADSVNTSLVHALSASGVSDTDSCFAYDSLEPGFTAFVVFSSPAGYPRLGLQEIVLGIPDSGAPAQLLPARGSMGQGTPAQCTVDLSRPHFYFKNMENTYPTDVVDSATRQLSTAVDRLNESESVIAQLYAVAEDASQPAMCAARVPDPSQDHVEVVVAADSGTAKVDVNAGQVGELSTSDDAGVPTAGTYSVMRVCRIENGRLVVDSPTTRSSVASSPSSPSTPPSGTVVIATELGTLGTSSEWESEPDSLNFAMGSRYWVSDIEWESWGGNEARATGMSNEKVCEPSCAQSNTVSKTPVTLIAFGKQACGDGRIAYTRVRLEIQGRRPFVEERYCDPPPDPSPDPGPSSPSGSVEACGERWNAWAPYLEPPTVSPPQGKAALPGVAGATLDSMLKEVEQPTEQATEPATVIWRRALNGRVAVCAVILWLKHEPSEGTL